MLRSFIFVFLFSVQSFAQSPSSFFDGKMLPSGDGRYYGSAGQYYGKASGHNVYDSRGYNSMRVYNGRIYSNGQYYGGYNSRGIFTDKSGFYNGRSSYSNGSTMYYDRTGAYLGKESKGRIYDKSGRIIGTKK